MIEEKWEDWFAPWILERGLNYWHRGKVHGLYQDEEEERITATVLGTEEYEVDISLECGEIVEMYCSCPHAEEGNYCKHMAAVLYAAENDEYDFSEQKTEEELPWKETLAALSEEQMRTFLTEMISKSRSLQEQLVLRFGKQNPVMLQDAWEEQVEEIVRRHSGRSGYVNYQNADDFHDALDDFLNDRLPILLNARRVEDAFRLLCLVYETAMETGADDSGGSLNLLMDTCEQGWRDVLDIAMETEKLAIHRWFADHLHCRSWCFGTDQVEDFLFSYEWPLVFLRKNLKILDERIEKSEWTSYHLKGLLDWREDTMRKLGYAEEEINEFWNSYRDLSFVRARQLNSFMEQGAYQEAIALLLEGKEKDKEELWQVKKHSEKLIELYRLTGQEEKYQEELHYQVFFCFQQDMEYVKKLKEITDVAEWPELLEKLLWHSTTQSLHYELLAFDCQWQRLFETIKSKGELHRLDQYSDLLIEWSAGQVVDCYVDMLRKAMHYASNRQAYSGVISYLRRIRTYPGGNTAANALVTYWKEQFPRRSAMLDELRKAGV